MSGLNLNAIVSKAITPVHPLEDIELFLSDGQRTDDEGRISPAYKPSIPLKAQIQTAGDTGLRHSGMAGTSVYQLDIWIDGKAKGVDRITGVGGDMVHARGRWWLVTAVTANFTQVGWVCLRVTLQLAPPMGITDFYDVADVYGMENIYV
jgi:hypothetical protein